MNEIQNDINSFLKKHDFIDEFSLIKFNEDSLIIKDNPFSKKYFLKILYCMQNNKTAILSNPFWGEEEKSHAKKLKDLRLFNDKKFRIILFSSGSSGVPKGIVHDLESLFEAAKSAIEYFNLNEQHRHIISLPQHHIGGLMIGLRAFFSKGYLSFLSLGEKLETHLENNHYDYISLVPAQLKNLIKKNIKLKDYKGIILGGAKPDQVLLEQVKDYPVFQSFGMSESAAMVLIKKISDQDGLKVMPFRNISLNEEGELLIGSYGRMKGHVLGESFKEINNEYFQTKDIFSRRDGNYFFRGRSDLMINSGGENIDPIEIENIINGLKDVKSIHIISRYDEKFGEVPVAFLEPINVKSQVQKELEKKVLKYKWPKDYLSYPEYIKTQLGKSVKISRTELKKIANIL